MGWCGRDITRRYHVYPTLNDNVIAKSCLVVLKNLICVVVDVISLVSLPAVSLADLHHNRVLLIVLSHFLTTNR